MDYTIILSLLSIIVLIEIGNKKIIAWKIGIVSQLGWFYFIYDYQAYGLILMHTVYSIIYIRNLIKWKNE